MNSKLFLVFDENLYFYKYCNDDKNLLCKQVFSKNKFKNLCARLIRKSNKKVPTCLLENWYKKLENINIVIITDYAFYYGIKSDIKKRNPNCKIYMYLMNSITTINRKIMNQINQEFIKEEIYTFDYIDSINYGYKFKMTPYQKKEFKLNKKQKLDLLFIGRDKDRFEFLEQLYFQCKDNKLNTHIKVLKSKRNSEISTNQFISYDNYLDLVNETSTILEIVSEKQSGITLRTLEALFYNKKLITNNKNIILYEFYNYFKKNILIIDINNVSIIEIINFIKSDYLDYDHSILSKIEFYYWLNTFK